MCKPSQVLTPTYTPTAQDHSRKRARTEDTHTPTSRTLQGMLTHTHTQIYPYYMHVQALCDTAVHIHTKSHT